MNSGQNISLQQIVPLELTGFRLDLSLARLFPEYSRSQLQNWIKAGCVKVDQKICVQPRQKVFALQNIEIQATLRATEHWAAQEITLDIVYEDRDIIIINKPVGLVVHPGAGNLDHTLVNALIYYQPELAHIPRAGIIHRLDKNTSGLLIIVKTLPAHHAFTQALKDHKIKREYLALVKGLLNSGGTIQTAMGRHPTYRTKMAVLPTGRTAITHYRILEKFTAHTLVQVELATGRTHQIRVHMNHIQHPLVGDPLYGKHITVAGKLSDSLRQTLQAFQRQALHAFRLSFIHPLSEKELCFQTPLPEDMNNLLLLLRENR